MCKKTVAPETGETTAGKKAINFGELYDAVQTGLAENSEVLSRPVAPMNVRITNAKPAPPPPPPPNQTTTRSGGSGETKSAAPPNRSVTEGGKKK